MKINAYDTENRWEYENGFYLTSGVERLGKTLAHYELYRQITELPGAVVECGMLKGASFMRWATFRRLLEDDAARPLIGFDAFGAFPASGHAWDDAFAKQHDAVAGHGLSQQELQSALEHKGFSHTELVAGDILETVPAYAQSHGELRIALLHIDVDVYAPTKVILEHLLPRMVPGSLLLLDDYGTLEGETQAVDEYFDAQGMERRLLPPPFGRTPVVWRKPY